MKKISKFSRQDLLNFVLNYVGKLGQAKTLSALRDGFAFITPLAIVGAIGVIFWIFVFGGSGSANTSLLGLIARADKGSQGISWEWTKIGDRSVLAFIDRGKYQQISNIGTALFYPLFYYALSGTLSIYVAFTVGYFYARSKNSNQPVIAGLVSLLSFFLVVGLKTDFSPNSEYYGTSGTLIAILSTFISIEIYCRLEKAKRLIIKMPSGVPPAIATSFSKLIPAIIMALIMTSLSLPFILLNRLLGLDVSSLGTAIYLALQAPFEKIATNPTGEISLAFTFAFLVSFFWFFGLHGSNIADGIFNPIWFLLLSFNVAGLATGNNHYAFAKGSFDAYVYLGGTGATLILVIATIILGKRKDTKEVSKFALMPGIFQVNEPVIFGYPMVLNPVFVLPFVFTMPILTITTWLAISVFQWVPGGVVVIPWTSPIFIGAFLHTGSWQGILLAGFNLMVALIIWVPFIFLNDYIAKKQGVELAENNLSKIMKILKNPKKYWLKIKKGKLKKVKNNEI